MKTTMILSTLFLMLLVTATGATRLFGQSEDESSQKVKTEETGALNHKMKTLEGDEVLLSKQYDGKVVMIVNTASKCGMTPQYKQLQELNEKYADQGLAILGFPCNQFGKQEPGTESEIAEFCEQNYGVTFDMFAKIDVNGTKQHPLYKGLTAAKLKPVDAGKISWNFEKFLIDVNGTPVARFGPRTKPDDPQIVALIEKLLKQRPAAAASDSETNPTPRSDSSTAGR